MLPFGSKAFDAGGSKYEKNNDFIIFFDNGNNNDIVCDRGGICGNGSRR